MEDKSLRKILRRRNAGGVNAAPELEQRKRPLREQSGKVRLTGKKVVVKHDHLFYITFVARKGADGGLRIGITGTFGTKKTDLAKRLAIQLGLPVIVSQEAAIASRYGIKDIYTLLQDKSLAKEYHIALLLSQLQQERQHPEGFVADLTTLECLARWVVCEIDDPLFFQYRKTCITHHYDAVIHTVPPETAGKGVSEKITAELDTVLRDTLRVAMIPHCEWAPPHTEQEILEFVRKAVVQPEPA